MRNVNIIAKVSRCRVVLICGFLSALNDKTLVAPLGLMRMINFGRS